MDDVKQFCNLNYTWAFLIKTELNYKSISAHTDGGPPCVRTMRTDPVTELPIDEPGISSASVITLQYIPVR